MPRLESLDLSYCSQVDDDLMDLLSEMQSLSLLVLMHCRGISSTGLTCLKRSPSIQNVYIDGCTMLSDAEARDMEYAAPQINLIRFSL